MAENTEKQAAAAKEKEKEKAKEKKTQAEKQPPKKETKKPDRRDERIEELEKQLAEQKDALLRTVAEFDNYKKRTAREKDAIYSEAVAAAITKLLPVLDNLERAASADGDTEVIKKGIEMTLKQFSAAFEALGVQQIEAEVGSPVDPNRHNAMMRVDDPQLPEGSIAEVLAKGYKIGERVIRHTMVKSAN